MLKRSYIFGHGQVGPHSLAAVLLSVCFSVCNFNEFSSHSHIYVHSTNICSTLIFKA